MSSDCEFFYVTTYFEDDVINVVYYSSVLTIDLDDSKFAELFMAFCCDILALFTNITASISILYPVLEYPSIETD